MHSHSVSLPLRRMHTCTHVVPIPAGSFGLRGKIFLPRKLCFMIYISWKGRPCSNTLSSPFQPPNWEFQNFWLKSAAGFISNTNVAVVWLAQRCVLVPPCFEPGGCQQAPTRRYDGQYTSRPQTADVYRDGLIFSWVLAFGRLCDFLEGTLNWKCHRSPLVQHGSHVGAFGVILTSPLQVFLLRN